MLQPNGNIKLIDFGIAREYKEQNLADTVSLGTKGYAAPEQFGGKGQTDARTDVLPFPLFRGMRGNIRTGGRALPGGDGLRRERPFHALRGRQELPCVALIIDKPADSTHRLFPPLICWPSMLFMRALRAICVGNGRG